MLSRLQAAGLCLESICESSGLSPAHALCSADVVGQQHTRSGRTLVMKKQPTVVVAAVPSGRNSSGRSSSNKTSITNVAVATTCEILPVLKPEGREPVVLRM